MSVWVVRAGKRGELEQAALEGDMAVVGWRRVQDLTTVENRQALEELCRTIYPESPPARLKTTPPSCGPFANGYRSMI